MSRNNEREDVITGIQDEYAQVKVVCLCGSTKFKEAYIKAAKDESFAGNVVLMSPLFSQADGEKLTEKQIETLEQLHRQKIQLCDEVLVINRFGYIGESTCKEIESAEHFGKRVRYLEDAGSSVDLSELSNDEIWCALENPQLSSHTQEISSLIREIYKQYVFRDVSNELNTVDTRLDWYFDVHDGVIEAGNVIDRLEDNFDPTRNDQLEGIIAEGMIYALEDLARSGYSSIKDMPLRWSVVSREFCKIADKQGLFVQPFFEDEYVWGRGQVFADTVVRIDDVVVERRMIPVFKSLSLSMR